MRPLPHAAILASLALAATPALAADPVEGEWLTQSGSGKVRIAPCPNQLERLCGQITWLRRPEDAKAKDANNPDPALRTRTILGLPMLWGFKQAGAGRWSGGKIYDPEAGKTYDSKLSIRPDGALKVEGCILMVCQAQTWRRS